MGAIRVIILTILSVSVFMMGEFGTNAYQGRCTTPGVFGAGAGDFCRCQYYFCVFYTAFNTWVRYPYNCSVPNIPSANFSFSNVTRTCVLNTTMALG